MATISAALVKELRESTGAGMMDCKAALTETDGDFEAAVDWLRKKGLSKAAIDGISRSQGALGIDLGAAEAPEVEPAVVAADAGASYAAAEVFELLAAPRGAPDDLAKLNGVGPQLVKKLNDAGVFHYWQIAAMTAEDVQKVDADLKLNGRITRDGWVDQARALLSA